MVSTEAVPQVAGNRFVGQSVKRAEDPRLLTGRGRYIDDVVLPGLLHAAFVRSPLAHGQITRISVDAARQVPGIVAVFTARELNAGLGKLWHTMIGPDAPMPPVRPLAESDVRFVGDPVAVVVAETRYAAEDGAELVELEVDPLGVVVDAAAALADGAPVVHPELGSNLAGQVVSRQDPRVEQAFAEAASVVTETFHQHRYNCVPMEPRGLIVSWDPAQQSMTIYASTQGPHEVRANMSRLLQIPEDRIRVVMGDVGGAFGQKMFPMREDFAIAAAARLLGRPVKWIEDRNENLLAGGHAREEQMKVSLAIDAGGHFTAITAEQTENVGAYPFPGNGSTAGAGMMIFPGPYRIPRMDYVAHAAYTNTCGRCAYRGPWMMETVAREQAVDLAARRLGVDPLELRRRNVIQQAELPYQSSGGFVYDSISPAETLEQAAELISYDAFRREQAAARSDGRYLGIGLGLYVEPSQSFGPLGTEGATLRLLPGGTIALVMGTGSHGQSLETTMAQVVADELGCDVDDITFVQGDTAFVPYGAGTGGSRSAVVAAGAARVAAGQLRERVLDVAGAALEAASFDLEIEAGRVFVKGVPSIAMTFAQVADLALFGHAALPPEAQQGLEVTARFTAPPFTFSNACHACTVEVNPRTGEVQILRYVVSEDCGVMINPMVVEGQIAGGVVQGIGGTLYEHFVYDPDGNPLTTTFLDYLLPTAADAPQIEYGHVVTPSPLPGGAKGMGEGGAIASPPAILNAINDALAPLGAYLTEQPFTPARLIAAMEAASSP